jgi:N6-L-threonylcarbamoyladenine synthase
LLYLIRDNTRLNPDFISRNLDDLCASLQSSLIRMLLDKLKLAVQQTGIKQIAIAGGVSANHGLQQELKRTGEEFGWTVFIPAFEYCTDNAAMIGIAAYYKFLKGEFCDLEITPLARMPIR